jgi:hypothetical protein
LNQRAAQAAAWHLANDMSWEELAAKRIVHLNGTSEMWFNPQEIKAGMEIARTAMVQAELDKPASSTGEGVSLNKATE